MILFLLEDASPAAEVGYPLIESHPLVAEFHRIVVGSHYVEGGCLLLLLLAFLLSVFPAQLCHSAPSQLAAHSLCTP